MIQEVNDNNTSTTSKQKLQNNFQRNNSLNCQKLIAKSQKNEMGIEVASSNQLIGFVSTQDSNYIKSRMEPKNLNIYNTNMIFFP